MLKSTALTLLIGKVILGATLALGFAASPAVNADSHHVSAVAGTNGCFICGHHLHRNGR